MDIYPMNEDQLVHNANVVMCQTIQAMATEGVISDATARDYVEAHVVILVKKGLFSKLVEVVFGLDTDRAQKYRIVKIVK